VHTVSPLPQVEGDAPSQSQGHVPITEHNLTIYRVSHLLSHAVCPLCQARTIHTRSRFQTVPGPHNSLGVHGGGAGADLQGLSIVSLNPKPYTLNLKGLSLVSLNTRTYSAKRGCVVRPAALPCTCTWSVGASAWAPHKFQDLARRQQPAVHGARHARMHPASKSPVNQF
jgi:hypothetical protein